MTATLYDITAGRHHGTADPVTVAPPRRRPASATIALFGLGMTPGFLLASVASAQGGAGMVHSTLTLAGISALVTAVAALRSRRIAVRRRQRLAQRSRLRPAADATIRLRRAA